MPTVTYHKTQEPLPTDNNEFEMQTGEQGLQQAMCTSELAGLDTLLQKIMDPNTQAELLKKPKSLKTSKRPRNKRKSTQEKLPLKPSYNPPIAERSSIKNDNDPVATNESAKKGEN